MWKLAALFIALAIGFGAGWRTKEAYDAASQLKAAKTVVNQVVAQAKVDQAIALKDQAVHESIRTVTQTIVKEVPVYVTKADDARCSVPNGFVRVHDAAARGEGAGGPPAGKPDDAASGVALSEVATVVAENYGSCHAIRSTLIDLQDWERARESVP